MNEQIVQQSPVKHKPVYRGSEPKNRETVSITEEDDRFYSSRLPTSAVNRSKIPLTAVQTRTRTIMCIIHHDGPPSQPTLRASRQIDHAPGRKLVQQPQAKQKLVPPLQTRKHLHWLFYVGSSMVASMALWIVGNTAVSFAHMVHDYLTYGTPHTYQIDANVGHQGASHFIVENLHGDILVLEIHPSDLAETHLYQGPVFSGPGADDDVATISFQDVNGDGKPDLIIAVNHQHYVLVNTGTAFRPTTPADHINLEV